MAPLHMRQINLSACEEALVANKKSYFSLTPAHKHHFKTTVNNK